MSHVFRAVLVPVSSPWPSSSFTGTGNLDGDGTRNPVTFTFTRPAPGYTIEKVIT
jgi:hypothetical protein